MEDFVLRTPVLFLIFNRPDTTVQVFEAIRYAQPPRLYIAADGPRPNKLGESEKVVQAREMVLSNVDWECDVKTLFRDENMGLRRAVSGAIDWFFKHEEYGIILEDDVVPHPTFFRFSQELLEQYRDDERVMHITGLNTQFGHNQTRYSYFFSIYNHYWGWASWRRAWKYYDDEMLLWPEINYGGLLENILNDQRAVKYWIKRLDATYKGKIESWGYRWTFACWVQGGLTICPNHNLIQNVGSGGDATHTKNTRNPLFTSNPAQAMTYPLKHPPYIIRHSKADSFWQDYLNKRDVGFIKRTIARIVLP